MTQLCSISALLNYKISNDFFSNDIWCFLLMCTVHLCCLLQYCYCLSECYYKLNFLITVSSKKTKCHKNCIVILHTHTCNVITKLWLVLGSASTSV